MSAPEVGARGPTGIGTAAQIKQQRAQFSESAQPLPDGMDVPAVIAKALLIDLAVHELPDGSFVLMQRGLVVPLRDLAAVLALLRRIGGAS